MKQLTKPAEPGTPPRRRVQVVFTQPSRTKQAHRDECDVNKIIARYRKTGVIEHLNNNPQNYDYAPGVDFQEALELVQQGEDQFNSLPASIRTQFDNDPASFVDFVSNPDNMDKMIEMGLAYGEPSKEAETAENPPPEGDAASAASTEQ